MKISILEQSLMSGYAYRTKVNAENAEATIAIAVDFSTGGEKLTQKVSVGKFLGLDPRKPVMDNAIRTVDFLQRKDARTLNIAGNGIYSYKEKGWNQDQVNQYFVDLFKIVHKNWPIESIRSGGQTGADWAGLVAASVLDIPSLGYFPKGFLQRNENRKDFEQTDVEVRKKLEVDVEKLVILKEFDIEPTSHEPGPK